MRSETAIAPSRTLAHSIETLVVVGLLDSECGGSWNNPIGLVPLSNGTHVIEYMGTGYGSTRFALMTEQANATWKLKSFKIEEKRFTPKTSCGVVIPIDNKDYNTNTTPLFTASSAITTVSVPATPTPKRVMITGSIAAGASPAQFGASLSFSTTVGKVYTIYLENVGLEMTNFASSYQNYIGYAVVNNPADAGDEGKMLANGSLGYTSCYKGYAITFVARATTTWLMLGGMVATQDAAQPATVSIRLQKLRIVGSQPTRRTVQLLAKGYRYGYSGAENIDEVYGKGNLPDLGDRLYDPRLGRMPTLDRLFKQFPSESNYSYAGNNPIFYIDEDGKKKTSYYTIIRKNGTKVFLTGVKQNDYKLEWTNKYDGSGTFVAYDYSEYIVIDYSKTTFFGGPKKTVSNTKIDYSKSIDFTDWLKKQFKPTTDKEMVDGGITFTSANGQNQETRHTFNPEQPVSIDDVLAGVSAVKAAASSASNPFLANPKGVLEQIKNAAEKFDYINTALDLSGVGEKVHKLSSNKESLTIHDTGLDKNFKDSLGHIVPTHQDATDTINTTGETGTLTRTMKLHDKLKNK